MQPIQLELTYFGPYENSTIDFSHYYDQSLFLITGKTGAGKTTIFDGMCYALYGNTSGGLRQGKEMRSNFSPTNQKTKVTFTFKQNNQTFVIEREPEQIVKKQRGDGYRESPATVKLTVFDANQKEVEQLTKQKEVNLFLSELIQLNASQFSQIVMLPQGEFRRFLIADSDAKEKVLRKLFNTYFYQTIAANLRERKKEQENTLKKDRQELTILVSQLEWPETSQMGDLSTLYYQEILALYKEQELIYQQVLEDIQSEVVKRIKEKKACQEKWQNERKFLDYFEEQQEVIQRLSELAKMAKNIEVTKQKVTTLLQVQKIQPTFQRVNELEKEKEITQQQKEALHLKEIQTKQLLEKVTIDLASLIEEEAVMKEKQKELETIEACVPLFEQKKEAEIALLRLDKELEKTRINQKEVKEKQEAVKGQIQTLETEVQKQASLTEQKFSLTQKREELKKQLEAIQVLMAQQVCLEETQMALDKMLLELTACKNDYQHKIEERKQLKSDWAKSQIARLSLELLDNEPCPVCGSIEHPNVFCNQELTPSELKQLEIALETSEKEEVKARDAVTRLESNINFKRKEHNELTETVVANKKEMGKHFETKTPMDEWLNIIDQKSQIVTDNEETIKNKLSQIEQKKDRLDAVRTESIRLEKELSQIEMTRRTLEDEELQLVTTNKEKQKNLPEKWQSLDEMLKEKDTLAKQIAEWTQTKQHLEKEEATYQKQRLITKTNLANETAREKNLLEKLEPEIKKLTQFLETNELQIEALEQILLDMSQLDSWTNQIKEHEQQEYALNKRRKELDTLLHDRKKPNLEPLKAKESELEQLIEDKNKKLITLENRFKNNQKIVANVLKKEATMKVALDELAELTQLANVLSGDGNNKLSLERFVLQTYLKRILQRANEKLTGLTNGRYQFELKTETGSFKKKTGLEINIFDDNAGAIRSVNTLSGGESFIAALSLALSLAEVIQEESGGIRIDAMFIDEGFGSLDEEALEMAIRALERIQGKGRLIGIISHVRELKERIPQQLQVKTTTDGKSYVKERLEFE